MKKKTKHDFDWRITIEQSILLTHLKSHYLSIQKLIKYIFFNKDSYETMNLKYDEEQPKMLFVIKDNKWIAYDKDYILDSLVLQIWSQLYNCYIQIPDINEYKKSLVCEETYERLEKFMDEFNKFCNSCEHTSIYLNEQKKSALDLIILLSKKNKKKLV